MDTYHWKNISDLAKDLVSKLICQKDKRITINEALEHKWIKYPQQLVSYIGTNNRRRYIWDFDVFIYTRKYVKSVGLLIEIYHQLFDTVDQPFVSLFKRNLI